MDTKDPRDKGKGKTGCSRLQTDAALVTVTGLLGRSWSGEGEGESKPVAKLPRPSLTLDPSIGGAASASQGSKPLNQSLLILLSRVLLTSRVCIPI
jgi:hypothetical protein